MLHTTLLGKENVFISMQSPLSQLSEVCVDHSEDSDENN